MRSLASVSVLALALGGTAAATAPAATAAPTRPSTSAPASAAAGSGAPAQQLVRRLIVRTANGRVTGASVLRAAQGFAGVPRARVARRLASGSTLVALSTPLSVDAAWRVARSLQARSDIAYAEPDLLMHATATSPVVPDDPAFPQQWDLWDSAASSPGGFSVHAPSAWARTSGSPQVVVAVLDTGITSHPELTGQTVPGWDFVSGDGSGGGAPFYTANDGSGRDPDPSDPGDWVSPSEASGVSAGGFFASEGCPADSSSWHGTHVTGTIVARRNNGLGITGIAPGVRVQPLRVLGKCGGYTSDIADAIRWASGADIGSGPGNPPGPDPTPASVINLSLSGPGPCDPETQSAIDTAVGRGTTVVVAAGNDSASVVSTSATTGSSPADCRGVVDVVATDRSGGLTGYSNYGSVTGSTVIAAPGGDSTGYGHDILSTVNRGATRPTTAGYAWYAGTSMAAPHVAAAAALLQSLRVGRTPYTPAQVATLLSGLTRPFPSSSGCSTATCGTGVLDLSQPLPTFAPLAPTDVTASPGDGFVTVSWTPGDTGGTPVTYAVESSTDGVTYAPAGTTAGTSLRVDGLADGTDYWFRVHATSATEGAGPSTATGPVAPAAAARPQAPAAPRVLGAVERLAVSWSAPPDGGSPLTGYSVEYRPTGSSTWLCARPASPTDPHCLVPATLHALVVGPGLAAGEYDVRVAAANSLGLGAYSPVARGVAVRLRQSVSASSGVLRPYVDGYQDYVTLTITSNVRSGGALRVTDTRGRLVRELVLRPGTAWHPRWSGRDQRGRAVPYGRYHIQVLLRGRSSTPTVVSSSSVLVERSAATRPRIALTTATVYPARDGYRDRVGITARATVPATYRIEVVGSHGVVRTFRLSRRVVARVTWDGTDSRHRAVAAGRYRVVVTATGGQGPSVSSSAPLQVSAKRLRGTAFHVSIPASLAPSALLQGTITPVGDGLSLHGTSTVLALALDLPSALRYSSVRVVVCTAVTNAPTARARVAYLDSTDTILSGPWALPNAKGCYVAGSPAPAASVVSRALHVAVANVPAPPATSGWLLSRLEVTGTAYHLA